MRALTHAASQHVDVATPSRVKIHVRMHARFRASITRGAEFDRNTLSSGKYTLRELSVSFDYTRCVQHVRMFHDCISFLLSLACVQLSGVLTQYREKIHGV